MLNAINQKLGGKFKAEVKQLSLNGVKSRTIEGLTSEFTGLQELSMNNVGLASLGGLPRLESLVKLELDGNLLKKGLETLALQCPNLETLSLRNNKLISFAILEDLRPLQNLQQLNLAGNEDITKDKDYRQKVFNCFPTVQSVDEQARFDYDSQTDQEEEGLGSEGEHNDDQEFSELYMSLLRFLCVPNVPHHKASGRGCKLKSRGDCGD